MASAARASLSIYQQATQRTVSSSIYVCSSCRTQLQHARTINVASLRHASSSEVPFTEKVRRKIWGTDNPPGLKDPYGGPSFLERRRMRNQQPSEEERQQQEEQETQAEEPVETSIEQKPSRALKATRPKEQDDYVPAETWDGLVHVGHRGHWKDMQPKPQDSYESFHITNIPKAQNRTDLVSCLHQAIVECFVLQQNSHDPSHLRPTYLAAELENIASSRVLVDSRGTITGVEFSGSTSGPETAEAYEYIYTPVADEVFLGARLDFTDRITSSILKRFSHLSGHRIPDPVLSALSGASSSAFSSRTPSSHSRKSSISDADKSTLAYLIVKMTEKVEPKPQNVAEKLMQIPSLTTQGNVMVLPRRETPIDKEKEVGRWKVIERELMDRGLPVTGKLARY